MLYQIWCIRNETNLRWRDMKGIVKISRQFTKQSEVNPASTELGDNDSQDRRRCQDVSPGNVRSSLDCRTC